MDRVMRRPGEYVIPREAIPEVMTRITRENNASYVERTEPMFTTYWATAGELSPFFLALVEEKKIVGGRCPSCGMVICPPYMTRCPACQNKDRSMVELELGVELPQVGWMLGTPPITVFANARFARYAPFRRGRVILGESQSALPVQVQVFTTAGFLKPGIFKRGTKVKMVFRSSRIGFSPDYFAVPLSEVPEQLRDQDGLEETGSRGKASSFASRRQPRTPGGLPGGRRGRPRLRRRDPRQPPRPTRPAQLEPADPRQDRGRGPRAHPCRPGNHRRRDQRARGARPDPGGRRPQPARHLGTLRICLERLSEWQGQDAPTRVLMFTGDVPRLDDPLPRFIDDAAAAKLLRAARAEADPFARLCVEFLARAGLRRSEFINLTVDSLVQIGSAYWLHVPLGKMRTDRYIPLHPQLKELLDDWVSRRPTTLREPWLFVDRGRRIGVRRVEQAVANVARDAGIGHLTQPSSRPALYADLARKACSER